MRTSFISISTIAALASIGFASGITLSLSGAEDVRAKLEPLLSENCYDCHDDVTEKGGLNLLDLEFEPESGYNLAVWEHVFDRVDSGEMPPKKKPRPDPKLAKEFLKELEAPLTAIDLARKEMEGRVKTRRLTRREYEYTVHDLLGIDIPLQILLPADGETNHFETVASGQHLSHFNLARYLEVADLALDEALGRVFGEDKKFSKTFKPDELKQRTSGNNRSPQARGDVSISWPMRLQFYGRMHATEVREPGFYRITLKGLHGINAGNGSVWGTLSSGECSSDSPMMNLIGLVEATSKKRDLVFEAWMNDEDKLELKPNDLTCKTAPSGATGGSVSYKGRDLEAEGYEGIAWKELRMERIYPHATREKLRQNLFGDIEPEKLKSISWSKKRSDQFLKSSIKTFAGRAFRRPVSEEQLAAYIDLAFTEAAAGPRANLAGIKAAYRAILCSPRFLTFVEAPGRLDDHALASRLSYMLWNSMPDRELRSLADKGRLSDYKVRHGQVNRLLADPKADRFIASFTDQWLKLKEINFTAPDRRLYKTFDPIVQESILQETREFVKYLITENLDVTNLIDSDFAMLNERLKRFYGYDKLSVKPGNGLQNVSVGKDQRSGLVAQSAILKVTADGTTTSPVIRGVWVGERILGLHIPPPPPGVPAVEPDIRGAVSIRDQLDKHRNSESCASCHTKIDPAGFALETFDAVGLPRKKYGKGDNAAVVDPSGVTPEGEKFANFKEWQNIYSKKPDLLAKNFATQLLTYATGAPPSFSDREGIAEIVSKVSEKDYGMKFIVHSVVASEQFRSK